MKFRKKPIVIEARQMPYPDEDIAGIRSLCEWCGGVFEEAHSFIRIETLEGVMFASPDDWIICGIKGEFYPCRPDIFAATYEPA